MPKRLPDFVLKYVPNEENRKVLSVIKSFQVDSSENASYIYLLNNMHDNDEAFRQHYETVHNFPYKPLGNDVPLLRQIPTTDEMNMTSQYQSAEDMLLSGIPSLNQAPPTTLNYYYYPDSDLETIIEESSVLDSEDERSPRFNHNPINSFPMNRRNTGNRRSSYDSDLMGESSDSLHSTLSDASSRGDLINSYQQKQGHFLDAGGVLRKDTQTVQHSPQSSLLSGSFSTDEDPISPLTQQRIVYAKCLTSSNNNTSSDSSQQQASGNDKAARATHHSTPQQLNSLSSAATTSDSEKSIPTTPDGLAGITTPDDSISSTSTITQMFEAARLGNLKTLANFPVDELTDTLDEKGNTALHISAENGNLECIKKLCSITSPGMIVLPNDDLLTPTGVAIKNGHFRCVEWMLRNTVAKEELSISQQPASIDGYNIRPPAAHVAARYNQDEILDWLCGLMLDQDLSVDLADHSSNTSVHIAARYGNIRCIQALVARGATITLLNSDGETPAQAAQKRGHDVCVGYLVVVETCVSLAQQVVTLRTEMQTLKDENEQLCRNLVTEKSAYSKLQHLYKLNSNTIAAGIQQKNKAKHSPRITDDPVVRTQTVKESVAGQTASKSPDVTPADVVISEEDRDNQPQIKDNHQRIEGDISISGGQEKKVSFVPNVVPEKRRTQSQQHHHKKIVINNETPDLVASTQSNYDKSVDKRVSPTAVKAETEDYTHSIDQIKDAIRKNNQGIVERSKLSKDVHIMPNNDLKKNASAFPSKTDEGEETNVINKEIEDINKDHGISKKAAWEKLSMDEMLKMVREMRYQPSPSISLCTEDSTMESLDTMKDRMVAASRWFLVEKSHGRSPQKKRQSYGRPPMVEQPVYVSSVQNKDLLEGSKQQTILQQGNRTGTMRHMTSKPGGATMPLRATQHFHQSPKQHNGYATMARERKTKSSSNQPKQLSETSELPPKNNDSLHNGHHRKQASSSSETSRTSSVSSYHTNSPVSSSSGKEGKKRTTPNQEDLIRQREETSISPKAFGTSQRSGSYRRAMEVRPNPTVSSSNDSLSSTNSTPSTVRSGTLTRNKKGSSKTSSTQAEVKEPTRKPKESSAFTPVRYADPVKDNSKTTPNTTGAQRTGMWTKPIQNKSARDAFGPRVQTRDRPGFASGPPVPSHDQSMNESQDSLKHDFLNSSRPKGYNWVNSYFRNKNTSRDSGDEQGSCEQPELKTNIQPKQNSFLRKVQGKRKVKT